MYFDKIEKQKKVKRSSRKKPSVLLRQVSQVINPAGALYSVKNHEETKLISESLAEVLKDLRFRAYNLTRHIAIEMFDSNEIDSFEVNTINILSKYCSDHADEPICFYD